jgi:hypothetical protein
MECLEIGEALVKKKSINYMLNQRKKSSKYITNSFNTPFYTFKRKTTIFQIVLSMTQKVILFL